MTATPRSNRFRITNHVAGANNPFHLVKVMNLAKLRIPPPTNFYTHKTSSTLLVFSSPEDAEAFKAAIPATTFGPLSTYANAPRPNTKPPNAKPAQSRAPLIHVVVRGVSHDIADKEFLAALSPPESCPCGRRFARAQRIITRDDQPTGLVRLFMTCKDCCEALLKDGLAVHGRPYKVEPPRNMLIRPCGKCHEYGHDVSTCSSTRSLCRVCGDRVPHGTRCDHQGHDLSRPYCATCNKFGHYTGQRQCPRYPRDPKDFHTAQPARLVTPAAPKHNPWNMRLTDFPALRPEQPLTQNTTAPPLHKNTNETRANTTTTTATEPEHDTHTTTQNSDEATAHKTHPDPETPRFVTHEALTGFLDTLLTVVSEGFKMTFDALLSLLLTSAPAQGQQRVMDAVNSVTKRLFETRTILQSVGSGLNVIHTDTKRAQHGSRH